MKLYYYDDNGYYCAMSEAFLNPLETELQGKEVWLIPPHATTIKPPSSIDGYKLKFNGKAWKLEKIPGPEPEPELTLEELKAQKLELVDAWTADKITGGFISECTGSPVRYDSDRDTQLTVSSDLNTINSAPDKFLEYYPNGYPMRGYPDGGTEKTIHYLTVKQLIQWNVDLGLHRGACKQAGWEKQALVDAADSKEALDAIILEK